jgi:hypothetical protein
LPIIFILRFFSEQQAEDWIASKLIEYQLLGGQPTTPALAVAAPAINDDHGCDELEQVSEYF